MVYTYTMVRTQIYLAEGHDEILERLAKSRGTTKSALIREAIEDAYCNRADGKRVSRGLRISAGAWKRRVDGAAYVERIRDGRLHRLHRKS
jgi:predicted transcriptional regulator